MNGNMQVGGFDLGLIIAYIVGVVALGCWAGAKRKTAGGEGSHYFLANNSLRWPVIGLAMFAANISTVHLVSLAEAAFKHGLVFGNFEWMAGFTLVLLSLFFAPLYLRSKVATLPDFIERRFNRPCRDILTIVSLFSAIVIHIGVALYTAAWVLCGILNIDPHGTIGGVNSLMVLITLLGVLTGLYTLVGGLLAVVWTESIQTVLLLVGAVVITAVSYMKVGGWSELVATLTSKAHPMAGEKGIPETTALFLHMSRPADDPSGLKWLSVILGYPVLGIWYWCADQTIVQRVLAAKDEKQARLGPLFCAFLKILPVFLFVLPGVMCVALVQQGAFGGASPKSAADTYTFMVTNLLPVGLKGLVAAAMLAAAMQTCSAALNSTATLFAFDLYKRFRPATPDPKLVSIGKLATAFATILAIASSPLFGHYSTIFEGINRLIAYTAPPVTAVFLFGVFSSKASGRAAFGTFVVGLATGLFMFAIDFFNPQLTAWLHANAPAVEARFTAFCAVTVKDFMLLAFYLFLLCSLTMIVFTKLWPEPLKKEAEILVWRDWREPLRGEAHGRGLGNYRVLSVVCVGVFAFLYWAFQ